MIYGYNLPTIPPLSFSSVHPAGGREAGSRLENDDGDDDDDDDNACRGDSVDAYFRT